MSPRARAVVVTIAAVAGAALTARLGLWQLDRAAAKIALQRSIDERGALPPLPAADLARDAGAAAAQHHRHVTLAGRWLPGHTVFLDNRQMHGRPGFFVITPLLLGDGTAVVVQRGWTPRDALDRTRLPAVPTPEGEVRVSGRIAPPPSRLFEFAGGDAGAIRQNLDMPAYAAELARPLRPLSVQQLEPVPAADGLQRDWPAPAVDVSRHHGYAFQWFAFSALISGLYVWFQLLRPRRLRDARRG